MNRNVESGFAYNPTSIDMKRSRFDRNSSHKTTFNVGELIPFYVDEVLPGDTFDVTSSKVIRLQTPLTPFMDNLYLDFFWFFVPSRLTWNHWKEFMGENSSGYWYPTVTYTIPQLVADTNNPYASYRGVDVGSVADYMGIPLFTPNTGIETTVNALPFRAYGLIYNEWFRDQNLIAPDNVPVTDSDQPLLGKYAAVRKYNAYPYKVAKYHDYFTSCLPAPQKGPSVDIPIDIGNIAPVVTGYDHNLYSTDGMTPGGIPLQTLNWHDSNDDPIVGPCMLGISGTGSTTTRNTTSTYIADPYPSNLWADLEASYTATTINELRLAFQIQKLYEKDARGGTRYVEMLKSHFGVTSPDYRLQRPEYLGGNRVPINVNQVVQNSETSGTSPLGNTGAMSVTSDVHSDFTKSFTEHGYILGLCCARYDHTYQQGLERFWSRKERFDYYFPVLANIGEQPVLNKEIYLQGISTDDEVFGYQEAWADYRYKPSRVSGEMRSAYPTSLDVWHLADDYVSLPYLSQTWIEEDKANVDRVLAVQSNVSNQLFMDVYVKNRTTRVMPLYSIPGLIDHH